MDAILLGVTGLSLAAAATMGVLLARTLRDERRRSDARVALLTDLAARHEHDEPLRLAAEPLPQGRPVPLAAEPVAHGRPMLDEPVVRPAAVEPPVRRVVREQTAPVVRTAAPSIAQAAVEEAPIRRARTLDFDDIDLHPAVEEVSGFQELFHDRDEPSAWPRRIAVVGGLAAVVVAGFFAWSNLPAWRPAAAEQAGQLSEVAVDTPLELLSLRHAQQDGVFSITGLVQNPRAGRELTNVKVTLFVFGPGGTFLTSGRAPLDFTALGPGDESSFVVNVPVKGDVARYRIGFRGEDDRVLAHVDRRTADAVAQR